MTKEEDRLNCRVTPSKAFGRLSSVVLLALAVTARGQETATPEPKPSPSERSARISFLPPPIDGTISLGIYDTKGKLVRVLKREADTDEFNIGADALSTTWDGKDDAGENLPAGKYRARGFAVGDLKVDGVGFFFNDWMTRDDSPRITRIANLREWNDKLLMMVVLRGELGAIATSDLSGRSLELVPEDPNRSIEAFESSGVHVQIENGRLLVNGADGWTPVSWSTLIKPEYAAAGCDGSIWLIDRVAENVATLEVKQLSANGEFLRRLAYLASDPQPRLVAPSKSEDRIVVLEEAPGLQRVRCLSLVGTKTDEGQQPTVDWKVDFEKRLVAHKDFSLVDGKPVPSSPTGANAPEKLKIRLRPNPLIDDERVTVELAVGFDAEGSFLKTGDGLPLFSISETPGIVRGLLVSHGSAGIDVFQDDGAVVEQFQVTGVDQMMTFDCGSLELK